MALPTRSPARAREHPITFRPEELNPAIRARGVVNRHLTAKRDLGRYYVLLADELESLPRWNLKQLQTLAAIITPPNAARRWTPDNYRTIAAELAAAIALLGGSGRSVFIEQVQALTPGQTMALIDALERAEVVQREIPDWTERLRAVGLIRD